MLRVCMNVVEISDGRNARARIDSDSYSSTRRNAANQAVSCHASRGLQHYISYVQYYAPLI